MQYSYHVVEEVVGTPETGGGYSTYGLELTADDGARERISDISVCKKEVERMAVDFNRHQLFPVHFHEAVYDRM